MTVWLWSFENEKCKGNSVGGVEDEGFTKTSSGLFVKTYAVARWAK